jgi:signal peptidase
VHWSGRARYRIGLASLFAVFLWASLAAFAVVPMLFGWRPVVVASGSMGPSIGRGDIVVTAPSDGEDLTRGTIVSFRTGGGLVTHRIVGQTEAGYLTRGDGNGVTDSDPLDPSSIVGVGRILVPAVGWPVVWARSGSWGLLSSWVAVMVLAFRWSAWAFLRPIPLLGRHGAIRPWTGSMERTRPVRRVRPSPVSRLEDLVT